MRRLKREPGGLRRSARQESELFGKEPTMRLVSATLLFATLISLANGCSRKAESKAFNNVANNVAQATDPREVTTKEIAPADAKSAPTIASGAHGKTSGSGGEVVTGG